MDLFFFLLASYCLPLFLFFLFGYCGALAVQPALVEPMTVLVPQPLAFFLLFMTFLPLLVRSNFRVVFNCLCYAALKVQGEVVNRE